VSKPISSSDANGSQGIGPRRRLTPHERAAQKRIADLRMRLLDLTNANRLLNFKFSGRSTRHVRLIDELPDQMAAALGDNKRLTFVPLPEPADEPPDEATDEFTLALEEAKRSDAEYLKALETLGDDEEGHGARRAERQLRDGVRAALKMPPRPARTEINKADWAKQHEIEPGFDLPRPYDGELKKAHADSRIQTLLFPDEMDAVLSKIQAQAQASLQETGVNTLYLALGYLEWYEAREAQAPMYAPLLLQAVDLERKIVKGRYQYSIGILGEEDPEINITLSERLLKDFGRRLPRFEEGDTPESYFTRVENETLADQPRWRLRRFAAVGHFAFARLVMFRDLADDNWPDGVGVVGTEVVGQLFTGAGGGDGLAAAEEYSPDDPAVEQKAPLLVTDADASQFSCIVDAMEGKNLAIKGPPGTGKSQTITNIIAAALHRNRTVLFVAEKMAALNVVKDRLEHVGLGHFCLELHSTKVRKKDVIDSLDARRKHRPRHPGQLGPALEELKRLRQQLADYVTTLNQPFGSTGKTIHDLLWAELRTRNSGQTIPAKIDDVELPVAKVLTAHEADALKAKLLVAAQAYGNVASAEGVQDHPWRGVGKPLNYFDRERLIRQLGDVEDALAALEPALSEIGSELGARPASTMGESFALQQSLSHLPAPAPDIELGLYVRLGDPTAFRLVQTFRSQLLELRESEGTFDAYVDRVDVLLAQRKELQGVLTLATHVAEPDTTLGELNAVAAALHETAENLARAIAFGRQLTAAFGVALPLRPDVLNRLLDAAQLAVSLPEDAYRFRQSELSEEAAPSILEAARDRAERLHDRFDALCERLKLSSDDLDTDPAIWRGHADVLRGATWFSWLFRRDVRAAAKAYRLLLRPPEAKVDYPTMARDFDEFAQCCNESRGLADDAALKKVCGAHFLGHRTPFAALITVSHFGRDVVARFGRGEPPDDMLKRVLLTGSTNALHQIRSLGELPEAELARTVAAAVPEGTFLEAHRSAVLARAEAARRLQQRTATLGLRPETRCRDLATILRAVEVRVAVDTTVATATELRALIGAEWDGARTDPAVLGRTLRAAQAVDEAKFPSCIRQYLFHRERDARIGRLAALQRPLHDALSHVTDSWAIARTTGGIEERTFLGLPLAGLTPAAIGARLKQAREAPEALGRWTAWIAARDDCHDSGLGAILEAFLPAPPLTAQVAAAFDRVFYRTLVRAALAEHPAIGKMRGPQLDDARHRFREIDTQVLELQAKELAAGLCRRPVDPGRRGVYQREHTGMELINRECGKQRRHVPIRDLLDRAGVAIQQLKPCFMMSPLSIAQFLKTGGLTFDLVIIDEASQMRPEEALGAAARGKQLIVVGDPKQLPPTSFFERMDRGSDEELEEDERVENESILDLALAEFRPYRELRWHYRSRHESLIAFSNRQFYNDDLIVFPSPLDLDRQKREPKFGVFHRPVKGTYKGHINVEEAQRVAEAVNAFMRQDPTRSLGVVTLNQPQRDIVQEMIDRLVLRDAAAQEYVQHWDGTLEPFFVKNLENVQGDERDVIFISTVYGPDAATGVVMNRFGPINGINGHRRLNVLFTRAKHRVELFTSMQPSDIKTGEGTQPGVDALQAYLEYAETGQLEAGQATGRPPDSDFEKMVREMLEQAGYKVIPQLGVAGYFIDLVVKHPHRSGYLLGIECDGATYHSGRSVRDRDRLRQTVLERLQWRIYRIWSTDWFHDPREEFKRLLGHIEALARADRDGTAPPGPGSSRQSSSGSSGKSYGADGDGTASPSTDSERTEFILVCPHCHQKNRVPRSRRREAICGLCKTPL
jgi:very-short-patch-repair endonuclease